MSLNCRLLIVRLRKGLFWTPLVVEIPAAETTAVITDGFSYTTPSPRLITVVVTAQAASVETNSEGTVSSDQAKKITATIDGTTYSEGGSGESAEFTTFPFTTEWTYDSTTLELTYSARQTAFIFSGAISTEITIPSEHTHVTINGMETAVDLPGLTTLIEVSDSTNVILTLDAITTTMDIPAETVTFSITADTIRASGYCGSVFDDAQKIDGAATGSLCIPGISTVIALPSDASALYLNAAGITTEITLPGITTTFVPEQTIDFLSSNLRAHGSKIESRHR